LQFGVEKLLAWPGFEPTVLDFSSRSDAYDLLVTIAPSS